MQDLFDKLKFKKIYFAEKSFSPDAVCQAIGDLAAYLQRNRLSDSPFVFLYAYNHIKTVIAYFAIIQAGMIVVLVNPETKLLELQDLLNDSNPAVLIHLDKTLLSFEYEREIIFRNKAQPFEWKDNLSDVCTMVYTAAENGYYKGAMLTKNNIRANAKAVMNCDEITSLSTSCALAPFHHLYAFQTGVLGPLTAGGSLLIEDITDFRRLRTFVANICKYGVTNMYSLPVVYHLMAKIDGIHNMMQGVNSLVSGGIKLTPRVFETFYKRTKRNIHEGYGLTEASPVCSWHRPHDNIKLDSVGRAFSCCEVNIMNGKSELLSHGEVGEICIRGDNVMKGYYGHPKYTGQALSDGWLRTGDLGRMDEDGYVYLTGMKKNMLNVGGLNVYPAEVERLMRRNDNVIEVKVYGEESALGGHTVRARVKLREENSNGQKSFNDWCSLHISRFKIPTRLEFV